MDLTELLTRDCAAQHFGPWLIEPQWANRAVIAIRAGQWQFRSAASDATAMDERPLYTVSDGIAIVRIVGQMQKATSSLGGASTIQTRRALRAAVADKKVNAVLLSVDSPGGTLAGTEALANEVTRTGTAKPTWAYIEDLGASAAYWVASQAVRVSANRTAMVGSIGTVMVIEDTSARAEQEGVKVHVVSTGAFKGAGYDGAPVTEEYVEYAQDLIDKLNASFLTAVKRGRNLAIGKVREVADGRVFVADDAAGLGLIDAVESFDDAFRGLRNVVKAQAATPRRDAAERRLRMTQ